MALSDQNLTAGDPRDEQKLSRGNVGTVSDAATPAGTRTVSQESRGNVGTVGGILLAASLAMAPILEIPAAGGGITGTLSQTLANATLASTGAVLVSGTASPTLGTLTLAGTGGVLVQGTLAQTLGALTVAGTATHPVIGTLATTFGDVSLTGSGGILVSGSLSSVLGDVTLSATGTVKSDATGLNVIFGVPGIIRTIPAGQVDRVAMVASRFTPVLANPITRSTDTKPIYRLQVV